MLGLVLVDFMNRDGGVDNGRLDGFLLDDGLNGLQRRVSLGGLNDG